METIIKDVLTSEESVYLTPWAWSFELGCGVEQDMEEVDYWCLRALSGEVLNQGVRSPFPCRVESVPQCFVIPCMWVWGLPIHPLCLEHHAVQSG